MTPTRSASLAFAVAADRERSREEAERLFTAPLPKFQTTADVADYYRRLARAARLIEMTFSLDIPARPLAERPAWEGSIATRGLRVFTLAHQDAAGRWVEVCDGYDGRMIGVGGSEDEALDDARDVIARGLAAPTLARPAEIIMDAVEAYREAGPTLAGGSAIIARWLDLSATERRRVARWTLPYPGETDLDRFVMFVVACTFGESPRRPA